MGRGSGLEHVPGRQAAVSGAAAAPARETPASIAAFSDGSVLITIRDCPSPVLSTLLKESLGLVKDVPSVTLDLRGVPRLTDAEFGPIFNRVSKGKTALIINSEIRRNLEENHTFSLVTRHTGGRLELHTVFAEATHGQRDEARSAALEGALQERLSPHAVSTLDLAEARAPQAQEAPALSVDDTPQRFTLRLLALPDSSDGGGAWLRALKDLPLDNRPVVIDLRSIEANLSDVAGYLMVAGKERQRAGGAPLEVWLAPSAKRIEQLLSRHAAEFGLFISSPRDP